MIGTMADNVDNFAAVVAMPPFWVFPWFFVGPGVAIAVLGLVALRNRGAPGAVTTDTTRPLVLEGNPS